MKSLKENIALVLFVSVIALLVSYLSICYFYSKEIAQHSFEECLATITNEGNWTIRKDTIKYCVEQTK